jgi:hypothetical protein
VNNLFTMTAGGRLVLLRAGGQELQPLVRTKVGRELLALPGSDVEFLLGRISPSQIMQFRPSYINAILIQSRGGDDPYHCCGSCRERTAPFPYCRRFEGQFEGACGNCKWRDHGQSCSLTRTNGVNLGLPASSRSFSTGNGTNGGDGNGDGTVDSPIILE